jgi:flagellar basal body-associated protein FliL
MATPIDQMMGSMGSMAWSSMGSVLFVFIIFFIILIVFGGLGMFMWWKSYNVRVTVFQPLGQAKFTEEELREINDAKLNNTLQDLKFMKEIKFDYMKKRVTHGKYISVKGTSYFTMFMPMKKMKPVPLEMMYNDGIYLVQLSKDVYVPVPRPSFIVKVGQNMSISVAEQQEWLTWSNMMADRVNAKWQNPDAEKKATLYFVIGIVAMVIVGGLILWFIYASAQKGLDVTTFSKNFAAAVAANPGSVGGIIPK